MQILRANNLYGAAAVVITAAFIASFSFSYWPVTEGWFVLAGLEMLRGQVPYVDFSAYLPPLYYWLSTLLALAPDPFLLGRVAGIGIFALIAYSLVITLIKLGTEKNLASVTVITVICMMSSGNAYFAYDFLYVMYAFFAMAFLFMATPEKTKRNLFIATIFLALGALTKQSNGGVFLVGGTLCILVLFRRNVSTKGMLALITVGYSLVVALTFLPIFLMSGQSLTTTASAVFEGVVSGAIANKGGTSTIFQAPWLGSFFSKPALVVFLDSLATMIALTSIGYLVGCKIKNRTIRLGISITGFVACTFYFSGFFKNNIYVLVVFSSLLLCLASLGAKLWLGVTGQQSDIAKLFAQDILLISSILSLAILLGSGTSGGLTYASISLSFYFVVIALSVLLGGIPRYAVIGIFALLAEGILNFVEDRTALGWEWWGLKEEMRYFEYAQPNEVERGRANNAILNASKSCTSQPETMMAYPHMTSLVIKSGLQVYSENHVFWFDYLTTKDLNKTIHRLTIQPPDLFVRWNFPYDVVSTHRSLFKFSHNDLHTELFKLVNSRKFESKFDRIDVIDGKYSVLFSKGLSCDLKTKNQP